MKDGGNAADAAVAVSFCLGVVEFQSSGLGGGGFLVHYNKSKGFATSIDFRSAAPSLANTNTLNKQTTLDESPERYIAVPGELKGLHELWKNHGKSDWKDLIAPSIKLARDGFTVSKDLADAASNFSRRKNVFTPLLNLIRPNGNPIQEGTTLKRRNLALTLEKISLEPDVAVLYEDEISKKIIEDLPAGSLLGQNDFQSYTAPENIANHAYIAVNRIMIGAPLPASGVIQLLLQNILRNYNNNKNSALAYHRIIESFKFGFSRRNVLGDPENNDIIKSLYNEFQKTPYAYNLKEKIDDTKTFDLDHYTSDLSIPTDYSDVEKDDKEMSTTHIAIIDQHGNAVSLTTSVGLSFGSRLLLESTGILLNSDMVGFSFRGSEEFFDLPYNPSNLIVGGKRPLSSMCPTIVTETYDGRPRASLVVGGAGGSRIITAVSLAIIRHLLFGEEVCESVNDKRLHHQLVPNKVYVEPGFSKEMISELEEKGHKFDFNNTLGSENKATAVHAVSMTHSGSLMAVCDKRLSGKPAGW